MDFRFTLLLQNLFLEQAPRQNGIYSIFFVQIVFVNMTLRTASQVMNVKKQCHIIVLYNGKKGLANIARRPFL